MPTSIDTLQIEIDAKAVKANDAIDRLVGKLNGLTTSLGKLNTSNLNGLANGVQKLGNAMQVMNTVKTADFTRLAKNLSSMGNINTQGLNNTASSLSQITRAMNNIGAVSHNAVQLSEMAKNLSKFGGANVQRATVNIPLLANELRKLMMTLSSAPNVSRNIIDMTNALANLSTQGSKVGSASRSIQRSLNGTATSTAKASKGFNGLASAIGKFYASYFMVIRGVKGIWSSINTTADYVEAFNYYTVSFGKIASKWDKNWENYGDENARNYSNSFVTTMNDTFKKLSGVSYDPQTGLLSETGLKNLGLNLQEVTQFAAQLGSMMDAVGHSGETTLATTNAFVRLAGDISSLYNIDYSEAAGKLRSVLQGQSRAGYGFGWDTTMASLQATADELNLSKAVSEMSQMEKQQLRILTILNQSRVAYGDQSNTINTLANQLRLLKNNIKEASMVLGQLFVPILSKLIPIINGTSIAIKRLLSNLASIFGIKIEDTGQGFTDMKNDAENLEDTYDDLAESIKVAKAQLLGFDEVNKLQDTSATATVDAEMGGIDLTDEILKATDEYQKIWQEAFDKMEANSNKWADKIEKALSGIGDVFEDFTLGEYFKAGEDVSQLVIDLNNFIAKAIRNVDWKGIGNNVGLFLKGIKWSEVFMSLQDVIYAGMEGLFDFWIESMKESPIETALLTAIALTRVDTIRNALASKLATVGGTKMTPFKIGVYLTILVLGTELAEDLGNVIGKALYEGYDPLIQIEARNKYESELLGIENKYEELEKKAQLYAELSKNYDNLSAEDKQYVAQLGQELLTAGIVDGINKITGAWEKTNEELSKAIQQQKILAKLSSAQGRLSELEVQYAEELERNKELEKKAGEFSLYHIKYQKDYEISTEKLKDLEEELYVAQLDVTRFENQHKDLMGLIGEPDLITDTFEDKNKKESIWVRLRKDAEAYNRTVNKYGLLDKYSPLKAAQSQIGAKGITSVNNELDPFANIDINNEEALRRLDELIFKQEDTKNEIEGNSIKTNINNSNYINGMNYATTMFNDFSYLVNGTKLIPNLNNSNALGSIKELANRYNAEKKAMESNKIKPTVDTSTATSQSSGLLKALRDNYSSYKINATVDTSTADKQTSGFFKSTTEKYGIIKSIIKVGEDKNSLISLSRKITEQFQNIQLKMDIINVGKEVMATFKSIMPGFATGGFPEDGLFMANHNELVGQFSNGKTAVANNEQITQGIAQAVAPAVYDAVVSAMQNTQRGNSDVVVNIDGKQVFKAVQRQANDYTAQTGLSPFNI